MNIIVTSGAMEVAVDDIRTIKNSSTGSLGATIADTFADITNVVYIHTKTAVSPKNSNIERILINNSKELLNILKNNVNNNSLVIHAMAINDFKVNGLLDIEDLSEKLINIKTKEEVKRIFKDNLITPNKIDSKKNYLISLEKDIKVIDEIKKISPNAKLVAFKFLSNTTDSNLIDVAKKLKVRTGADIVVANKKENIKDGVHQAFIVTGQNQVVANTKVEIAKEILKEYKKL